MAQTAPAGLADASAAAPVVSWSCGWQPVVGTPQVIRTRERPHLADYVCAAAMSPRTRTQLQREVGCSRKDITRMLSHLVDVGRIVYRDERLPSGVRRRYERA